MYGNVSDEYPGWHERRMKIFYQDQRVCCLSLPLLQTRRAGFYFSWKDSSFAGKFDRLCERSWLRENTGKNEVVMVETGIENLRVMIFLSTEESALLMSENKKKYICENQCTRAEDPCCNEDNKLYQAWSFCFMKKWLW